MNPARIRPADWMTGAWGVVLVVSLFMSWFSRPEGTIDAWGAFAITDVLLALVGLLAVLLPLVTAARETPAIPTAFTVIVPALAFITLPFLVLGLVGSRGAVDSGGWIGTFALVGVFVSALLAQRDERAPGLPEPTEIPVMPAPPREATGSSRTPA